MHQVQRLAAAYDRYDEDMLRLSQSRVLSVFARCAQY